MDRAGLVARTERPTTACLMWAFSVRVPGLTILCPGCRAELREMLQWSVQKCSARLPFVTPEVATALPLQGTGNPVPVGRDITLITYGTMINRDPGG